MRLHLGIVELMTNIVKHAYDHDPRSAFMRCFHFIPIGSQLI